jgi:DNA-binding transcriptional MerR regulator
MDGVGMDSRPKDLASIGEFARRSRLSPKALRLYDRLGLLPPARVDPESGYRWYAMSQLAAARLIAGLRELGLPLAEIGPILALDGPAAAERIARLWGDAEAGHTGRRELARDLLDRLHGKEPAMYDVNVRDLPDRQILSLQRHLNAADTVSVGREFIGRFRDGTVDALKGAEGPGGLERVAGAPFVIFYGHVSEDSDGPVEWCRPVPADQAASLAERFPDLTLRTDPAHEEAFVRLATAAEAGQQWLPVLQAMESWGEAHHRQPAGAIRQLLLWPRTSPGYGPECDFAVPLVPGQFR